MASVFDNDHNCLSSGCVRYLDRPWRGYNVHFIVLRRIKSSERLYRRCHFFKNESQINANVRFWYRNFENIRDSAEICTFTISTFTVSHVINFQNFVPIAKKLKKAVAGNRKILHWSNQMMVGILLVPFLIWCCGMLVNTAALYYHTSRSVPFMTLLELAGIEGFIVLPLHIFGTIVGRQLSGNYEYPCRINAIPRPIPTKKWYVQPSIIVILAGLLPFGSIFIEMYFVFTSFWAYKIYYVYGFMLLVCLILAIVTICVNIVCTYFLLNSEDYRWQWTSFMAAASTSGYVYLYSIYYFLFKTKMYGIFQTVFYFSYMGLFCVMLGIMCGSLGYTGASMFVKKIYGNVKID